MTRSGQRRRTNAAVLIGVVSAAVATATSAAAAPSPAPEARPAAAAKSVPIGGQSLAATTAMAGTGPGVTALPTIGAATWVLADADTGQVLAAQGAHVRRAPASTLKMLTALAVIPQLDPNAPYRPVDADVRVSGSKVGLIVGSEYTNDELLTALFLPSANDAAAALARSNGGMTPTLSQMNSLAQRLNAKDTVAKNPSGLDAEGQLSSAYDLALIARAGLQNDDFVRYASTVRAAFPGKSLADGKRATYEVQNQNPLLTTYRGALGIKTGFTTKAGRTFVGAAERDGRTLIVTLMGIGQPTRTTAAALLDWGFANAARIAQPVGVLVEPNDAADALPVDDVAAAGVVSDGDDGPSLIVRGAAALAVVAGVALVALAMVNSEGMTRRRIRRRYR